MPGRPPRGGMAPKKKGNEPEEILTRIAIVSSDKCAPPRLAHAVLFCGACVPPALALSCCTSPQMQAEKVPAGVQKVLPGRQDRWAQACVRYTGRWQPRHALLTLRGAGQANCV